MGINPVINAWPEEDYLRYLRAERQVYAWILTRLASLGEAEAWDRATIRFPYESSDNPFRGLIFHAGAWAIATSDLFGEFSPRQPEEFGLMEELDSRKHEFFRLKYDEPFCSDQF